MHMSCGCVLLTKKVLKVASCLYMAFFLLFFCVLHTLDTCSEMHTLCVCVYKHTLIRPQYTGNESITHFRGEREYNCHRFVSKNKKKII